MAGLIEWINDSFRRRIAFVVSLLSLGLGAGVLVISYFEVEGISKGLISDRLQQLGEELIPILARAPDTMAVRMARVSADPAIVSIVAPPSRRPHDGTKAAQVLRREFPSDPRVVVVLLDAEGAPRLRVHAGTAPEWFGAAPSVSVPRAVSDSAVVVGPYQRLNDSVVYYDLQAPVRQNGRVVGHLVRRQRSTLSTASREVFNVILGQGTGLLLGSPATGIWTDLARIVPAPAESLQLGEVTRYTWGGQRFLGLARAIRGTPWVHIIRVAEPVIAAPARRYLRRGAFIAALVVLLGTLCGVALGRALGRPIQDITAISERIASVEDPARVEEAVPGEVGRLARAFNAMVERVALSTRRLRDNEASHRAFVTHSSQGIWRIEFVPGASMSLAPQVQVESWYRLAPLAESNAALARMCGIEPEGGAASVPLRQLFPKDDPAAQRVLLDFVRNGYRMAEVELTSLTDGDQRRIFVNDLIGIVENGALRRIWGTRRDVTLERLLDERLAQTDRLEAVGRLAGGIAHDFNNLLTAILGYAESWEERVPADNPAQRDVAEIKRTALRAAELTRQLLAFSRGQVMRPALIDLNAVVRGTEGLLRRVIGEDIDLRLQLADSLAAVEADPGQIERVIMNLAVNARDAMPQGGRLELRTAMATIDEGQALTRPGLVPGAYVVLAVSDTGVGMTDLVKQHIFEPFFTTKPIGKGTGLGLSTVYGIVRQSGGEIAVYSEPGQGTAFRMYFPVRSGAGAAEPKPTTVQSAGSGAQGGTETILLVEDEDPVREVTRRALAGVGYTVLVARDGGEALGIEASNSDPIHLVLTDMILPGMSGRDLAAEFRKRRPGIKLVVMSGYTGDSNPALEGLSPEVGYLEKPFALTDLRSKVREALDLPPTTAFPAAAPPRP